MAQAEDSKQTRNGAEEGSYLEPRPGLVLEKKRRATSDSHEIRAIQFHISLLIAIVGC